MDHTTHLDLLGSDELVLLLKVGHSATAARSDADLYEKARKWWAASLTQAQRVRRVLGVAEKQVVAVWDPHWWEVSDEPDSAGKVAFHGPVASDEGRFLGAPVAHLYPKGAANPVRYTTVAAVLAEWGGSAALAAHASEAATRSTTSDDRLAVLLRINQSWSDDLTPAEVYAATRGYWSMAQTRAERVELAMAVAHGVVREVFEPVAWSPSPVAGEEHRIGFEGAVSGERDTFVGRDVSSLFPQGSQNPVRYVRVDDVVGLGTSTTADETPDEVSARAADLPPADEARETSSHVASAAPALAEQLNPLLGALEDDLLWSMSRAAQELFHSNTLGWLLARHPEVCDPLRAVFEAPEHSSVFKVWREWRHIDLVAQGADTATRLAVENKLYSIPGPDQLRRYLAKDLPWSKGHGSGGAPGTSYVLLSLMDPTFPLPAPWRRLGYEELLRGLEAVETHALGRDADLVERYRALVRRLLSLKEVVDPRQDLDTAFSVASTIPALDAPSFAGPLQRMRFTGLAQAVSEEYGEQLPLVVDISRALGSLTFTRRLSETRSIGWQFQEDQLRLFVLIRDRGLAGHGKERAAARAAVAEREYADFVDFTASEWALGPLLLPMKLAPGEWRRFAPDFVYRYRKVEPSVTTRELASALSELTAHVEAWGS